jgi:hypothetical protein
LQPGWRPSRRAYPDAKRIFNNGEEDESVSKITTEFRRRNLFDFDEDFKVDALAFTTELRSDLEAKVPLPALTPRESAGWFSSSALPIHLCISHPALYPPTSTGTQTRYK